MRTNLKYLCILFLISQGICVTAQNGKVVLIGGGMERSQTTSWNYQLFSWIVNNAPNKRVAVVGTSASDGWLHQNFVNTWGAVYSKEFVITSSNADSQILYDSLITYNAVYMRGGDQYYYYMWYNNTKTQQAIEYIYQNGGVIAGTSAGLHVLTDVIFTDDTGYGLISPEAIENPTHQNITLHDDFLSLVPGVYGDSHFAERGRFGRLVGIMANRWFTQSEVIAGIGVDDLTAIVIDENNIGTVYGTGCANIYIATDSTFSRYPASNGKLLADNIRVMQLLKGATIDLNTFTIINNMTTPSNVAINKEQGDYTLFLSGGNTLTQNNSMLQDIVNLLNTPEDLILILTGSSTTTAEQFQNQLISYGATNVIVRSAIASEGTSSQLAADIQNAKAFLFVNNTFSTFNAFLPTPNGSALKLKMKQTGMINGFVGDNSRFAGAIVVENYMTANASYYAEMQFQQGLSLLETTVIIPNTFGASNMYENAVTAVPYAMTNHGLTFGVWLYSKNYLKYYVENNASWFTSYGTAPVMILKNTSNYWENSQQTSTGSGTPRQITGFDSMELSLIDESVKYQAGDSIFSSLEYHNSARIKKGMIYPNPAEDFIYITNGAESYNISIFTPEGILVQSFYHVADKQSIDVEHLHPGLYIVLIQNSQLQFVQVLKFIKQ
jgi:cyanophycinase-like exopeptidase